MAPSWVDSVAQAILGRGLAFGTLTHCQPRQDRSLLRLHRVLRDNSARVSSSFFAWVVCPAARPQSDVSRRLSQTTIVAHKYDCRHMTCSFFFKNSYCWDSILLCRKVVSAKLSSGL